MRKIASFLVVLLCSTASVFAQSQIKGKITDSKDGTPLSSISVKVKGTNNGISTNPDGSFSINIEKSSAVLEFSGVGYVTQSLKVTAGQTVSLSLEKDTKNLSEVVVTALGIKRSEKLLGYSVSKVDPDVLLQKSEPDILKSLEGKVAGVNIQQSQGTPGAASRITIRGTSTFFGEDQPLFVVDGVPFSNDEVVTTQATQGGGAYGSGISDIDPNDIASINVLKGASASALYGSRGANGVIIITTKSGSASRSKKGLEVSYSSSVSIEKVANLPDYQNDFGQGAYGAYSNSNGSWGPAFGTIDSFPTYAAYLAAYPNLGDSMPYRAYPNNVKDLFRTGTVLENSVSFSGGDERSSVSATLSYINHDGYVPNSNYNRGNMSFGGSTKLDNGLTIRGNFSYSKSNQYGGIFGESQVDGASSQFSRSLLLARNWDLSGLPYQNAAGTAPVSTNTAQYDNPYWSYLHNISTTEQERSIAGLHLDYTYKKWLNFNYGLGVNTMKLSRSEWYDIGSRAASGKGSITEEDFSTQDIESNLIITATPNIGKDFSLKVLAGQNVSQTTTTNLVNTGSIFITSGIYNLHNTATVANNVDNFTRGRLEGFLADATLGYKNFAFVEVSERRDHSSTLDPAKSSYFYPSFSGSFIFTDAFKIKSDILDFGKIRGSWAKVGNDAPPYGTINTFILNPTILGQPAVSSPITSAYPHLAPEFTAETEVGTQLSFFKRRVSLDLTWYNRLTTNLITPITTPASSGFTGIQGNLGEIQNKGVEVDLGITPIRSNTFNWNIHLTFAHNHNEVLSLTQGLTKLLGAFPGLSGTNSINPYIEVGKPVNFLYGDADARDSLGHLLIDPSTGFLIRSTTLREIGDPNPDYKLGITNTFTYKAFTIDVLWDFTKGGSIYSESVTNELGRGVTQDTRDRQTTWVINGVYGDPSTQTPLLDGSGKEIKNTVRLATEDLYFAPLSGEGSFGTNASSEWNVYDATVWHLREVSVGYQLPKSLFKKLPIGSASISITGRNLWFYAPGIPQHTNFDPEQNSFGSTSTQGIELSAAPTTRRYGINLKVTF